MVTKRIRNGALLTAAAAVASGTGWGLPEPADARTEDAGSTTRPAPQNPDWAESYAQDFDVDLAEARERLAQQGELSSALVRLRQLAGSRFAGTWIEHQPEFRGVIRLTGPVVDPVAFDAVVADAPAPIDVRTDAPHSLAQLETERGRVQAALTQMLPGATTGIHEQSGSVMVYAPASRRSQRQASEDALPDVRALTNAPVRVTHDRGQAGLLHDYGGDRLSGCTSGFSVTHASGEGIVSAGHCGAQTYEGYNGETYSLTRQASEWSRVADAAVYTSSHNSFPEFYADSTTTRYTLNGVRLWNNQVVGTVVCHRGKTTGFSCGLITDRATTTCDLTPGIPGFDVCDPNWVRVEGSSLACFPGDSGGPWFQVAFFEGLLASGIMHGGSWTGTGQGQCNFSIYSPIDFKYTRLGAVVLTG
jgi:streptogrisin C